MSIVSLGIKKHFFTSMQEKFLVFNFVTLYHIVIFWNILNVSVLDCYVE